MLKITQWALRQPEGWQTTYAIIGTEHFAQKTRSEIQCLMIKFQQTLGPLTGSVVVGSSRVPAAKIARLAFAKAFYGKEVGSYNELTFADLAVLMGLLLEEETFALIMFDLRSLYNSLMQEAGHRNRPEVREKLLQRTSGVCEAWAHRHALNIDWREQPVGDAPIRGTEMHEIVKRGALPVKFQDALWHPGNCLMLSPWFHVHARYAIENVGWQEWGLDLLFLVRDKSEIAEFVENFESVSKHTEPAILEMKRRLAG